MEPINSLIHEINHLYRTSSNRQGDCLLNAVMDAFNLSYHETMVLLQKDHYTITMIDKFSDQSNKPSCTAMMIISK